MPHAHAILRHFAGPLSALCLLFVLAESSSAQQGSYPTAQLTSVYPAGGQQGTTVELTVAGTDLDDATALHFSHSGLSAQPKMVELPGVPKKAAPRQFVVKIDSKAPSGPYELRVVGKYGISNPRPFVVSSKPEVIEVDTNAKPETPQIFAIDSVLNGRARPTTSDHFQFTAKKGQRILIDGYAQRIDSRMSLSMVLSTAAGNEIARSADSPRRDPMLDFVASADGDYVLRIHDFLYRGGDDYTYRVAVHTGPHIDFVFPPCGEPGKKGDFTLYGRNLPGGADSPERSLDGKPLQSLKVQIDLPGDPVLQRQLAISSVVEPQDSGLDAMQYRLQSPKGESNPINIGFATAPLTIEQEPNTEVAKAQKLNVPCEVAGQFGSKGDQDWYTFEAKKGDVLWFEVMSERLGLPTDPYLLIQKVMSDKGEEKVTEVVELDDPKTPKSNEPGAANFDTSTEDPSYRFVASDDATYRVLVRDLYYGSRGAPQYVYRLSIRKESPDFRLVAVADAPVDQQSAQSVRVWSPLLHKGGAVTLRIFAFRRDDYDGDIELSVEGLPPGVKCPPAILGMGATIGSLVLTADENAAPWAGEIKVIGKAKIAGADVQRIARGGNVVWGTQNRQMDSSKSRMTANVVLAVSGVDVSPVAIEVGDGKPVETSLAGKLTLPVKVVRRGDFKGALKLTATGVPQQLKPADVDIAAGANEGKLNLDLKTGLKPGNYCFVLNTSVKLDYKRDPAGAEAAAAAAKEIAKVATEAAAESKKATDAATAAAKALTEATAAVKAATTRLEAAKKAADAKAGDQPLVEAKNAAEKELASANEKVKAAEQAKTTADAAATATKDKSKMLDAEKTAADARAKQMMDASKPKNISAFFVSTPVMIKVAPAPITVAPTTAPMLKKGAKIEVPVTISRQFGYADPVELTVAAPPASGLKIAPVTIAKDQTQAKVVVEVGDKAASGDFTFPLKAKVTLNGQSLTVEQPLAVKVE